MSNASSNEEWVYESPRASRSQILKSSLHSASSAFSVVNVLRHWLFEEKKIVQGVDFAQEGPTHVKLIAYTNIDAKTVAAMVNAFRAQILKSPLYSVTIYM